MTKLDEITELKARITELSTECLTYRDYETSEFDGVYD